jgi:hypothetical protein
MEICKDCGKTFSVTHKCNRAPSGQRDQATDGAVTSVPATDAEVMELAIDDLQKAADFCETKMREAQADCVFGEALMFSERRNAYREAIGLLRIRQFQNKQHKRTGGSGR